MLRNVSQRLTTILWLMALHSAAVGLGLILHPAWVMSRAGYLPINEPFFTVQGGVFHVLMAMAYATAARDLQRHTNLILFSIAVKSTAALFLILYWSLAGRIPVVLVSGLVDALMALGTTLAYLTWRDRTKAEGING